MPELKKDQYKEKPKHNYISNKSILNIQSNIYNELISYKINECLEKFRRLTTFPTSQNILENPYHIQKSYEKYLVEYSNRKYENELLCYNKKNPDKKKYDFKDINTGWKLSLSIQPQHVQSVSNYLIKNGYCHKYLHGGEPENGKIFTIYIGSKELTDKLAKDLAKSLKGILCKPNDKRNIEFAPGIMGRFTTSENEFTQYGSLGIVYPKSFEEEINKINLEKLGFTKSKNFNPDYEKILIENAEKEGMKQLKKKYDDYFIKF